MTPKEALQKGNAALKAGDGVAAAGYFRAVLARAPRHAAALKALRKLEGAPAQSPVTQSEIQNLIGLLNQNKLSEAEQMATELIRRAPEMSGLYNIRGLALGNQGKSEAALASFRKATVIDPRNYEALNNLGLKLKETGDLAGARKALEKALAINPAQVQARFNLGVVLVELDAFDEARGALERVVAEMPDLALGWFELGKLKALLGDRAGAEADLRRAIAGDPALIGAYTALAGVIRFEAADPLIAAMADLAKGEQSDGLERAALAFALGKAFEDAGAIDRSYRYYALGNDIQKGFGTYSDADTKAEFAEMKAAFASHTPALQSKVVKPRPIFITGMNRSGTSLVEQILAMHSKVHGMGEMDAVGDFAARHKPANFRYIGLIRRVFPEAPIICLDREARDLCFSNFKASVASTGHMYSYDQRDLAQYYLHHRDLMAHWHRVYGDSLYRLSYERLTQDPEPEIRSLLAYLGLEWEDQVMEFHTSSRAVRTLSQSQVRNRINTGSVGAWRRFESHLEPMLEILAKGGISD
jgi:tetratricopeptide (TPR) repeat protein